MFWNITRWLIIAPSEYNFHRRSFTEEMQVAVKRAIVWWCSTVVWIPLLFWVWILGLKDLLTLPGVMVFSLAILLSWAMLGSFGDRKYKLWGRRELGAGLSIVGIFVVFGITYVSSEYFTLYGSLPIILSISSAIGFALSTYAKADIAALIIGGIFFATIAGGSFFQIPINGVIFVELIIALIAMGILAIIINLALDKGWNVIMRIVGILLVSSYVLLLSSIITT